MKNEYDYLFKFILVGDTSNYVCYYRKIAKKKNEVPNKCSC